MVGTGKVLVTGGTGKAGKWVVADLLASGYDVTNVDLRPSDQVHTFQVDLCDLGQVFGVVEGKDAIVHCSIPPSVCQGRIVVETTAFRRILFRRPSVGFSRRGRGETYRL